MMYLPYKKDQEAEARKLMVDMFELVLPEKVSEAIVNKYVKLTYDPATKELVQIMMPFMTKSEVTTLTLDKGWVTEASVEDVKLLPGVRRTMFRLQGGEWVAREVVKDVQRGRAKFVLNTGDMVWWGKEPFSMPGLDWSASGGSRRSTGSASRSPAGSSPTRGLCPSPMASSW